MCACQAVCHGFLETFENKIKVWNCARNLKTVPPRKTEVPGKTHVFHIVEGRAVAQAVRRWLPIAAAQVRVRAACGVCGEQSGTVAGFLRVLRVPLPIIPPISPSS
jgi:hypothetical protein